MNSRKSERKENHISKYTPNPMFSKLVHPNVCETGEPKSSHICNIYSVVFHFKYSSNLTTLRIYSRVINVCECFLLLVFTTYCWMNFTITEEMLWNECNVILWHTFQKAWFLKTCHIFSDLLQSPCYRTLSNGIHLWLHT
jgi:hypothetical protein